MPLGEKKEESLAKWEVEVVIDESLDDGFEIDVNLLPWNPLLPNKVAVAAAKLLVLLFVEEDKDDVDDDWLLPSMLLVSPNIKLREDNPSVLVPPWWRDP